MSENELKIVFSADTEDIGTASERIDTLGGKLSKLAPKVGVLSKVSDSMGSFLAAAGNLDASFSDSVGSFLSEMQTLKSGWVELRGNSSDQAGMEPGSDAHVVGEQGEALPSVARVQSQMESHERLYQNELEFQEKTKSLHGSFSANALSLDKETWNERLNVAGASAGSMANILQNLYVASGSKHRAIFEAMKAFAVAEAVVQGARAAVGAYAFGAAIGGPLLGAAFASVAVAATSARIKQIAATKPGGATASISAGGAANPEYRGGSASAYPVPQRLEEESRQRQNVTINIHNPLSEGNWDAMSEEIVGAINRAGERNVALNVKSQYS